jgi:GNAT superfamily N-acetyltransferase
MPMRRATATDAETIGRLHIASYHLTYRGLMPDAFLDSMTVTTHAETWRTKLTDPGTIAWLVSRDGDDWVGLCACGPSKDSDAAPDTWEIYHLHVLPPGRGHGLGGQLFDRAWETGRGAGSTSLTLWVVEGNRNAQQFYAHEGMAPDGGRQTHPLWPGAVLQEVRYRLNGE